MSNIEVGEYVRTKNGLIDIYKEDDGNCMFAGCKKRTYWKLDIVNHSKNIIDLIEVGDYVNGVKVANCGKGVFVRRIVQLENNYVITNVDDCKVRSIVTKEMFLNAEYKVGE